MAIFEEIAKAESMVGIYFEGTVPENHAEYAWVIIDKNKNIITKEGYTPINTSRKIGVKGKPSLLYKGYELSPQRVYFTVVIK